MAEYEFECWNCKKIFTLFMLISERKTATVHCPGCGSAAVETLMLPFVAHTGKKN